MLRASSVSWKLLDLLKPLPERTRWPLGRTNVENEPQMASNLGGARGSNEPAFRCLVGSWGQDGPKMFQEAPQRAPRGPKRTSGGRFGTLLGANLGPKMDPQTPRTAPRSWVGMCPVEALVVNVD